MTRVDYAVIGAGAVGSCCALLLARGNKSVALIGHHAAPTLTQRTYALNRVSEMMLATAGIWHASKPSPYMSMDITDVQTMDILRFTANEVGEPNLGHMVIEGDMTHACQQAVDRTSALLHQSSKLHSMQRQGQYWQLELEDGNRLEASLVIAADGKHSHVCSLLDITRHFKPTGDVSLVANLVLEQAHGSCAQQWFHSNGIIAFLPWQERHRVSLVWSTDKDRSSRLLALDTEVFSRTLTEETLGHVGSVTLDSDVVHFPVSQHNLESYYQQGVVFIGDAAHSVHPLAGQGMNMGLHDCLVLLLELAVENSDPFASVHPLFRYQQSRQLSNYQDRTMMSLLQHGFRSSTVAMQLSRHLTMKVFGSSAMVRRTAIYAALYGGMNPQKLQPAIEKLSRQL